MVIRVRSVIIFDNSERDIIFSDSGLVFIPFAFRLVKRVGKAKITYLFTPFPTSF